MFRRRDKRECRWEGCTKRTTALYCSYHKEIQRKADTEHLMRAAARGAARVPSVPRQGWRSAHQRASSRCVWQGSQGQQQYIGPAVDQLNRWLDEGWGIAVYQRSDRTIEPVLAYQVGSFGGQGALIEDSSPPPELERISLFDGPSPFLGPTRETHCRPRWEHSCEPTSWGCPCR
jgi:hypothetical protein